MRAVGVEESAAVGAEFLDDLLRSHRTLRDGLLGDGVHYRLAVGIEAGLPSAPRCWHLLRFHELHLVVGLQVLHHALRNQQQSADDAERQQHPQGGANHINPEVSDGFHLAASDAANECDGQRDADGCRRKVVVGKSGHLGEVAHRRFAGVGLPVGVGSERSCGVEGQWSGAIAPNFCGLNGKMSLNTLNQVQHQHRNNAEQQHRNRVFRPPHFVIFVDAGHPVEQALDGPKDGIQKRALAAEHTRHEDAQRLGDQRESAARNTQICNQPLTVISEFLRTQQRVEQVHHRQCADGEHDERLSVHSVSSLHPIAEMHVGDRHGKECDGYHGPKNVLHCCSPKSSGPHHQEPCFRPHHQIRPTVAVFCVFRNIPCTSDRNVG